MSFNATKEFWIVELALATAALFIAYYGLKTVLKAVKKRFDDSPQHWGDKLDSVIRLPLLVIFWAIGLTFACDLLSKRFGFTMLHYYALSIRNGAIVGCLAWMLLRWKSHFIHFIYSKTAKHNKVDTGMVQAIGRILSIIIVILSGLIILQMFGLNIIPLLAFGGIGAAAVGFAGKDVIANFFGGFMLHLMRSFVVGDLIILSEHDIEGYVEEIGWYITSVRDKEKRPIYLPNAIFASAFVINSTRMSHRRFKENIRIRYEDFSKIGPLLVDLRKLISSHESIDIDLPILVFLDDFKEYYLDIEIDVYSPITNQAEFLALKEDLLCNIFELIKAKGFEVAYPTEVYINKDPHRA
jgi:MscS family membrane protein